MSFPSGRMDIEWGKPCACASAPVASSNPPAIDLAGVVAVYDVLARAVAIGKLSQGLGLAGGAELAAAAKDFAATSPTLAASGPALAASGPVETGGWGGAMSSAGKAALGVVERTAAALWKHPKTLLTAAGAVTVALASVSKSEAVALAAIASDTELKRETLLRMSPEEAAAWLAANPTLPPDDGGLFGGLFGDMGWIKWAALAVGGLLVWQIVKAVK